MLTYNLKIMIGCVSGRCLAESHIVAGLRVSSHARDPGSLDHRSTKVIVTHAEATPLFRSTRLHSRTFNIQWPCSRLETEAWKSDSWRCIFDLSNSVPGWSGPFFLCAKTARPLKDAEAFEVGKRTEDGTKLNYKRSTAFKSSSFPAFRGQMSVVGGKSKSRQCTLRATGENTAMETTYSSNTEHAEASMDGANSASLPGIICPPMTTVGKSTNIVWQECMVKREERQSLLGQKGCVIWITGLSGSGKSTLACTLDHALLNRGKLSYVLDGDNVRHGLNNNLGFSAEDRAENIRRVGEVAKLFVDAGIICIASVISPYRKDRDACRQLLKPGEFIEVFMNFPLKLCEERDPKGLYKLARAGKIKGFTGVDDPYEVPLNCEVVMQPIDGKCPTPAEMADHLLAYMEQRGLLGPLA